MTDLLRLATELERSGGMHRLTALINCAVRVAWEREHEPPPIECALGACITRIAIPESNVSLADCHGEGRAPDERCPSADTGEAMREATHPGWSVTHWTCAEGRPA